MQCKICSREDTEISGSFNYVCNCKYCGNYKFNQLFELDNYLDKSNFYKVSSYIREQNDLFKNTPFIDNDKFNEIVHMKDKKIKEKFDLMITYIIKNDKVIYPEIIVKSWIKDEKEYRILFNKAVSEGFIKMLNGSNPLGVIDSITFEGLEYVENLEEPNKYLKNIFIAFNFIDDLIPIFNNQVKEAVEETGFTYTIVNQATKPHDQKITDEIVAKIKSSKMIIADFTNSSTNVYFEAGFAMGMKIPVIWTCKVGHEFSFDTGQFPHITWKDADDLKEQLINRIDAIK